MSVISCRALKLFQVWFDSFSFKQPQTPWPQGTETIPRFASPRPSTKKIGKHRSTILLAHIVTMSELSESPFCWYLLVLENRGASNDPSHYPLVMTNIADIAIEHGHLLVDLSIKNCDFPWFFVCLPEGRSWLRIETYCNNHVDLPWLQNTPSIKSIGWSWFSVFKYGYNWGYPLVPDTPK